jgi:CRISPR/Cas system CSM-associated protein Csm3 (group 7 of RAMP superfamily)
MPLDGKIEGAMIGVGGVRKVAARWVITGELELDSAAHLGNGESSEIVDMPLLRDRAEGRPLLTGASLAGALRSHLNDVELGFEVEEQRNASALFGGQRGDKD